MKQVIIFLIIILLGSQISLAEGLKITEIDLSVDYDEAYTYRVEKKDRIDSVSGISNNSKINADIFPGANITFTIRIENSNPSSGSTLRGVFARINMEEIDDGDDLEEQSLDFDLEPGDEERVDVKFQIPLDIDTGTCNTLIEAEGEDRNGTTQRTEFVTKLEIRRQSHDIRITRSFLDPVTIQCDRKIGLNAEIMNLGSNPENQIALEFKSEALGINSIDRDIFLESSEEANIDDRVYEKSLNPEISRSINAGIYPIFVNLYWKNIALFDKKILNLRVRDCGPQTENVQPEDSQTENVNSGGPIQVEETEEIDEQPVISDGNTNQITSARFVSSPALIFIVLGAFVAFVLAIVAIFGYSRKK